MHMFTLALQLVALVVYFTAECRVIRSQQSNATGSVPVVTNSHEPPNVAAGPDGQAQSGFAYPPKQQFQNSDGQADNATVDAKQSVAVPAVINSRGPPNIAAGYPDGQAQPGFAYPPKQQFQNSDSQIYNAPAINGEQGVDVPVVTNSGEPPNVAAGYPEGSAQLGFAYTPQQQFQNSDGQMDNAPAINGEQGVAVPVVTNSGEPPNVAAGYPEGQAQPGFAYPSQQQFQNSDGQVEQSDPALADNTASAANDAAYGANDMPLGVAYPGYGYGHGYGYGYGHGYGHGYAYPQPPPRPPYFGGMTPYHAGFAHPGYAMYQPRQPFAYTAGYAGSYPGTYFHPQIAYPPLLPPNASVVVPPGVNISHTASIVVPPGVNFTQNCGNRNSEGNVAGAQTSTCMLADKRKGSDAYYTYGKV